MESVISLEQLVLSCMVQCCLSQSEHRWHLARLIGSRHIVIRDSLQALPRLASIRAGVVGFDFSPVLTLCLFDGLSEGVAGFLLSVRMKAAAVAFTSVQMLPVIHGFWLGYVRIVTVGTMTSMYL